MATEPKNLEPMGIYVPLGNALSDGAAPQHGHWRNHADLSSRLASGLKTVEHFLETAGFDRAPWLAVGFAGGIAAWFALASPWQWLGLIALCLAAMLAALAGLRSDGRFPYLRQGIVALALMIAAGCGVVWAKSALVGTPAIARPMVELISGTVMKREEQPSLARVRLTLAIREPETSRPIRVRLNLSAKDDLPGIAEGATLRLRARLMPPAPPMLPGGYDFARTSWFTGLAATGTVLGKVTVVQPASQQSWLRTLQRRLSAHVRSRLSGSPGTIAAAFASGDRGAIEQADDEAMRDAGLTHLLSISGLHVSAVVAAVYVLTIRLLALWPWLALRVRLPLAAAAAGALAGIGYTLLTGSEVPTIRSCIGAVLVLAALAIGREPLSLRMVAVAALFVLLFWPEAVVGPGFQMSFASVIAIVALHGAAPIRAFLAPREQAWWLKGARQLLMLLITGVVIELALMPIGLFHFHRAGIYGALANVIAIPLTTFVSMPAIALALLLDTVGLGAPAWWLAGKSLEALLALAHWTAAQPGAVTLLPSMGQGSFLLFVSGGLWLALWRGRTRLAGLVPALLGLTMLAFLRPPDVLISSDGRHVGITGEGGSLLVLREGKSDFAMENLQEIAGMEGETHLLENWPGARCNRDFCAVELDRGGRTWRLLIARGKDLIDIQPLAAACRQVDIVIADRRLPYACNPSTLKADRAMLGQTGGLTLDLTNRKIETVVQDQGAHGWWRPAKRRIYPSRKADSQQAAPLSDKAAAP